MDRINGMFEKVKDLEEVLTSYNSSRNRISHLEGEIRTIESNEVASEKEKIKLKISKLEEELEKTEEEISKINIFSKECHTLSDIRTLFDFVKEKDVLSKKVLSYLDSLIIPIFVNPKQFEIGDENKVYKLLKINLEVEEFFEIIKSNEDVFYLCENATRKKLTAEMEGFIPSKLRCYVDSKYLYLLCLEAVREEQIDEFFHGELTYVGVDYLNELDSIHDIVCEIFKKNLSSYLLMCQVSKEDVKITNTFLAQTEFFITDIEEWKLDCAMKEIINISRRERKWLTINWLEQDALKKEEIYEMKIFDSFLSMDLKNPDMLPMEISEDFYRILLCIKIILSCNSKRINKAEQFVERALMKMMNRNIESLLLHQFIMFSELTVFVRIFPKAKIVPKISNLREELFFIISKRATELNKSLNDSLLLLKVYFKEKHYDFMSFVDKFVPPKSKLAFEINFFNLIYANVCDLILCIKFMDNEKVVDTSRLIRYILSLSVKVPCGCIEQFKRLESFGYIFESPLEEIIKNSSSLHVSKKELTTLLNILFQPKDISAFLETLDK